MPQVAVEGLNRRDPRVVVLRRIISLKRRCNRCYLINVLPCLINLILYLNSVNTYSVLFTDSEELRVPILIFISSAGLILVGSVSAIYAMTQKFKKWTFIVAKFLMTVGMLLAILAALAHQLLYSIDYKSRPYGYPIMNVEDCESYPDHWFHFILDNSTGEFRPTDVFVGYADYDELKSKNEEIDIIALAAANASKAFTTTTMKPVFKDYECTVVLANVKHFKFLFAMMWGTVIIISTTVGLSYLNLTYLWCLQFSNNLVLHPAEVEPYQNYDELLLHAQAIDVGDIEDAEDDEEDLEAKRQAFVTLNMDLEFKIES